MQHSSCSFSRRTAQLYTILVIFLPVRVSATVTGTRPLRFLSHGHACMKNSTAARAEQPRLEETVQAAQICRLSEGACAVTCAVCARLYEAEAEPKARLLQWKARAWRRSSKSSGAAFLGGPSPLRALAVGPRLRLPQESGLPVAFLALIQVPEIRSQAGSTPGLSLEPPRPRRTEETIPANSVGTRLLVSCKIHFRSWQGVKSCEFGS